jgi:hypothetical protein
MPYLAPMSPASIRALAFTLCFACSPTAPVSDECSLDTDCEGGVCVDGSCQFGGLDASRDTATPIEDGDGDGISDENEGRDAAIDTDGDGTADYEDADSDGDGIPDADESGTTDPTFAPRDTDGDGTPDFRDLDSDGDMIVDDVETTVDTDGDGRGDYLDLDSDGDGIPDITEGAPGSAADAPDDTDGDGVPDFRDLDADADGIADSVEGTDDLDSDGIPNFRDPRNDTPITPITLTAISTDFNTPIGIDYHEPTNSIVLSANYPSGGPFNFELINFDGSHAQFSDVAGLTDEIKIGTVRSGNVAGFVTGDLFVGNGVDGQISRVSSDGMTVDAVWSDLPGEANGLGRGSLYVDRTGVFGGELIIVTTAGQVWRITADGTPTMIAATGVHLEGMIVVPEAPARYGPLSGRIIAGAENEGRLYAISADGTVDFYELPGVLIEDIDFIDGTENYFGVDYSNNRLLGAPATEFSGYAGDILLAMEVVTGSGLFILRWDGASLAAQPIPLSAESQIPAQWEHVTFAPAGIVEVPPII